MLGRLEHLADAHVDELVDGRPLGSVVRHGAHRDARGGDARGDATRRGRAEGRGGGKGVHGAESEGHPEAEGRAKTGVSVATMPGRVATTTAKGDASRRATSRRRTTRARKSMCDDSLGSKGKTLATTHLCA